MMEQVTVAIVGVGALGQMTAHELVRLGFKNLLLIDNDVFTPGNKNRQLYANDAVMGLPKVEVTQRALLCAASELNMTIYKEYLTEINGSALIGDAAIIVDCTDNIQSKLYLECLAEEKNIPLVHGAVEGWCGQAAVIYPGDRILEKIYQDKEIHPSGTYVPTVNLIASIQSAEVYKWAVKTQCPKEQHSDETTMRGQVLWADLMHQEYSLMKIQI